MELDELDKIVSEAVQKKLVVEVEYVRKDGKRTRMLVEPIDVAAGKRSKTGELKFWSWCLYHNRIEQRTIPNIISMRITGQHFDPKARAKILSAFPGFRIPRDWL